MPIIIKIDSNKESSKKDNYKVFIIKLIIIVLFIFVLLFLYKISNIIIILLFSLFLNILFSPLLNKFNEWKIPDIIGIIIIYLMVFLFILVAFFAILPIFINQFGDLLQMMQNYITKTLANYNENGLSGLNLPNFAIQIIEGFDITQILNSVKQNIGEISSFLSKNIKSFFSSGVGILSSLTNMLANAILVFVFTFFIALERKNIRDFFYKMLPTNTSNYILKKEPLIVSSISNWFKTQGILGLCIFICIYIGLNVVKLFGIYMDNIFTLSLIAGLMEFIPYVGPVLAALPAIAVALGISYKATFVIIILYIVIQQLENNLIVPYVMGKSLSLSPFAVLIAMTIGASIFGIIGIIIAIPAVAVVQIFIKDYLDRKKN